ncbi:hypothetical protein T440DRAFT_556821 [Plenodomus tracheiphilus IPT5]|uniref:HTH OST-type domain-containing protein n=1 Tax=Plenodomus tracheiphilus IPT5 TaxID=1408161 RepID=A0A6A7B1F7_9PLEO|nr:hypothetical protein T440DRAFT_556821 [Plenodomus tracheiphilus IPT5]
MPIKDSSLALLIDGDNVTAKIIAGLMVEIANYGTASSLSEELDCLLNHSITPIQQFAYTTGKNATDGAMIIDAMGLLYTGRFSSFCIVSSDSDFTRLAARIREQGVTVYGFGERKTNNAFIAACDKFMYFDVLNVQFDETEELSSSPHTADLLKLPDTVAPPTSRNLSTKRPIDATARNAIQLAIKNNTHTGPGDNWVNLADVGNYLSKIGPDLHARNYGYDRLRDFVEASGVAEVKYKNMGDKPSVVLVCLKPDVQQTHGTKRPCPTPVN